MSQFIGTRSCIQCRTHHQKYENKFGDCISIISIYKQEIGIREYKKHKKELLGSLTINNSERNSVEKSIKVEDEIV